MNIHQQINDSFQYELLKLYGDVFKTVKQDIYIDKLRIDVGSCTEDELQQRMALAIREELMKVLKKQERVGNDKLEELVEKDYEVKSTSKLVTFVTDDISALVYFLSKSYFPWWYKPVHQKTPCEIISGMPLESLQSLVLRIMRMEQSEGIIVAERMRNRFMQQLTHELAVQIITIFIKQESDQQIKNNLLLLTSSDVVAYILTNYTISKEQYHSALLSLLFTYRDMAASQIVKEFFKQILSVAKMDDARKSSQINLLRKDPLNKLSDTLVARLVNKVNDLAQSGVHINSDEPPGVIRNKQRINQTGNNIGNEKEGKFYSHNEPNEEVFEGVYLANGGLIILHPFLHPLFTNLGLLANDNSFLSKTHRERAIVVLSYLQYSSGNYDEANLVLNKVLTGSVIEEVLPLNIRLTDSEKKECEELLETVVTYWEALKGSGIAAMQQSFFNRNAKLSFKEDHWLLQIERNAMDVLIDRIPWGFGIIKLPWLTTLIHVEW